MEFKDYYKILEVDPDADVKDIKTAYRKLARKYHPDLNPDKDAEARFKEIAEAWEVLKDSERRAEYDELRRFGGRHREEFRPPPGWQSAAGPESQHFGGDFSDFFNSVFGGGFGTGSRGFDIGGQDVEIEMPVFLEETLADSQKPVQYEIPVVDRGQLSYQRKSLKVTVPAGVTDGERIRVRGQGGPSTGNAPPGDLYLHIRLVPHPVFDVEGHNLVVTVPVAPWEAALGAKVIVPTLDGRISLSVAPHSQAGQKLRVRGKGLPRRQGRGDLIAILRVVMPPAGSGASDELWRQLAREADFDPRAEWSEQT